MSGAVSKKLMYSAGGAWKESSTEKYMPCHDPSTGAVSAYAPLCTANDVKEAIQAAVKARESLGVFAGIVPWNSPVMIPLRILLELMQFTVGMEQPRWNRGRVSLPAKRLVALPTTKALSLSDI